MSATIPEVSGDTADRYAQIADAARALIDGETDRTATAANLSSLIYHSVPQLNWAGFYFFDGTELVVGPFQGKPACVRIPLTRGVCGAAARTRTTQRVDDVHDVPDHIACDADSRSEIVVPLLAGGDLIGVLDIDSPVPQRFSADDQAGIEAIAAVFVESVLRARDLDRGDSFSR